MCPLFIIGGLLPSKVSTLVIGRMERIILIYAIWAVCGKMFIIRI